MACYFDAAFFVPVVFAFGLAFAASAYFGEFLGRKLAD